MSKYRTDEIWPIIIFAVAAACVKIPHNLLAPGLQTRSEHSQGRVLSVAACAFEFISLLMRENYLMSADMFFFSPETFLLHTQRLLLTLL